MSQQVAIKPKKCTVYINTFFFHLMKWTNPWSPSVMFFHLFVGSKLWSSRGQRAPGGAKGWFFGGDLNRLFDRMSQREKSLAGNLNFVVVFFVGNLRDQNLRIGSFLGLDYQAEPSERRINHCQVPPRLFALKRNGVSLNHHLLPNYSKTTQYTSSFEIIQILPFVILIDGSDLWRFNTSWPRETLFFLWNHRTPKIFRKPTKIEIEIINMGSILGESNHANVW